MLDEGPFPDLLRRRPDPVASFAPSVHDMVGHIGEVHGETGPPVMTVWVEVRAGAVAHDGTGSRTILLAQPNTTGTVRPVHTAIYLAHGSHRGARVAIRTGRSSGPASQSVPSRAK